MADEIYAAGRDADLDDYGTWFWDTAMKASWTAQCQTIVDYVMANYLSYAPDYFGYSGEDVTASAGKQVAFGMVMWGFAAIEGDTVTGAYTGNTWNVDDTTIDNYFEETMSAYSGDADAFFGTEATGDEALSVADSAKDAFIKYWGPQDESLGGQGIPNIAGIKKLDDYKVEITVNGFDATAVYSLGITVAPLHYYGDAPQVRLRQQQVRLRLRRSVRHRRQDHSPGGRRPLQVREVREQGHLFRSQPLLFEGEPITTNVQFKRPRTRI
jgi:peptide/nickel transport system substrate-binding protein